MLPNLIFYNKGHIGDVIISKPFVREISKFFPNYKNYYSHFCSHYITDDQMEYIDPRFIKTLEDDEFIRYDNSNIYINTWLGKLYSNKSRFITKNGFNICHFETQVDRFNENLKPLGFSIKYMENNIENYIWDIDNKYIKDYITINKDKLNILIYTNKSLSGQADNKDLTNELLTLTQEHNSIDFYITDTSLDLDNVFNLNNYFPNPGLDLFQFAELSKSCNIIVGNVSGPFMMTWLKPNILDKTKIFISQHTINDGESQFWSKQPAKNICVKSTTELLNTLDKEIINYGI